MERISKAMINYIISYIILYLIAGIIVALFHLSLRRKYNKAMQEMQANFDRIYAENEKSFKETMREIQDKRDRLIKELNSQYNTPDFEDTKHEPPPIFIPSNEDDVQTA